MIAKTFSQITAADIDSLVENAVREGRTIEYKEKIQYGSDAERKEFLADVSSFANASGGDLLFGIEEERDAAGKTTGLPKAIPGLSGVNADHEIRRIENAIRDGIEPRIPGVQIRAIDVHPNAPVILVRVPHSWAAPHMVSFKASPRFFSRTSAGKSPLDVPEIRAAFVQSEAIPERIRRFREERIGRIVAGEGPMELEPGILVAMHIVPIEPFHSGRKLGAGEFLGNRARLSLLGEGRWNSQFNLDGYLSFSGQSNVTTKCHSYTQLFRNGTIEAVDVTNFESLSQNKNGIASQYVEKHILQFLHASVKLYAELEIEPPLTIMLSLIGAAGSFLHVDVRSSHRRQTQIRQQVMAFPEIVLESFDIPVDRAMRPVLDTLWQAYGFSGSANYDDNGEWKPR